MLKITDAIRITTDIISSQAGTPNGTRAIITIGEVNGIIDIINANVELGSSRITIDEKKATIMGIAATVCSCEES